MTPTPARAASLACEQALSLKPLRYPPRLQGKLTASGLHTEVDPPLRLRRVVRRAVPIALSSCPALGVATDFIISPRPHE